MTWAIDGVPIPNTNIASNIGPQIDPKDIDYIEAQRGGYSSAYGDRTYGLKLKKVTLSARPGLVLGHFFTSKTFLQFAKCLHVRGV